MSKTYHQNDPYPHASHPVADKFSIKAYFQRFAQLIGEQKFNKNTPIKSIFHMLNEVQPHFGDTAFKACHYIKLIEELEKLKKGYPTFVHDFKDFLKTNRSFTDAFIQHAIDKLNAFTKDELFAFTLSVCQFPLSFTHEQKKCLHQAMHLHLSSFNETHFCNSLELLIHLKDAPNTHWQKEWVNAFFKRKNKMDPAMLTYIADHIDMFDSDIAHAVVKDLACYKTQREYNAEPTQKISLHALTNTELNEITSEAVEEREATGSVSSVNNVSVEQALQKKKKVKPKNIILELKTFAHTTGEIYEGKINFFNRHLKKCFPDLSRKKIIQILYYYSLLQIDKNHALPILKRAKAYFEACDNLFDNIEESEFRKLIIAQRYFDVLGFHLDM